MNFGIHGWEVGSGTDPPVDTEGGLYVRSRQKEAEVEELSS